MPEKSALENPPEMEKLMRKYKGGKVPPLFGNEIEEGLLSKKDEEFYNIYLAGLSSKYNIQLHLAPDHIYGSKLIPDNNRSFIECCRKMCRIINPPKEDFVASECENFRNCFTKHIAYEWNGKARLFLCHIGMVIFAIPVLVYDTPVGILYTECRKPKKGAIWSHDLIGCLEMIVHNSSNDPAYFLANDENFEPDNSFDIWDESMHRIHGCEKTLGLNKIMNSIEERLKDNSLKEIDDLTSAQIIMEQLERASDHLSSMLEKTYKLEKESLLGWIRAEMASALSSVDSFWERIKWCLGNIANIVGVDYILLVSDKTGKHNLSLQCQYGLPAEALPALQYEYSTSQLDDLIEKIKAVEHIQIVDLKQYRVPILSTLYSLYGKGVDYPVIIIPNTSADGGLSFMLLGRRNIIPTTNDSGMNNEIEKWLKSDNRNHLITIVRELSIITRVLQSIKKIQEAKEEQTDMMELLAHDLKTPINNIMVAADNLRNARTDPERASRTIAGVITQLGRLNLLAEKAWMLEQIRQDSLIYNDDQSIDIHEILVECNSIMADLAENRAISIQIDPDLKSWQRLGIDAEKFRLVAINLIQNGLRYSYQNTCIKISGWESPAGIFISFSNVGIPIHDAEKDRIFERYFRSKEARMLDPSGSGIGLVLVKEFVDHYRGRIDVESNEIGFSRYLNVFSIYLPRG